MSDDVITEEQMRESIQPTEEHLAVTRRMLSQFPKLADADPAVFYKMFATLGLGAKILLELTEAPNRIKFDFAPGEGAEEGARGLSVIAQWMDADVDNMTDEQKFDTGVLQERIKNALEAVNEFEDTHTERLEEGATNDKFVFRDIRRLRKILLGKDGVI